MTVSLQDHKDLIIAQIQRIYDRLKPTPNVPKVAIMVMSGLHDGVAQDFETNVIRIGSDGDCHMVLVDEGIAGQHVQMTFDWSLLGRVAKIQTTQKDVVLNGSQVNSISKSRISAKSFDLEIGGILLRLNIKKAPHAERSNWGWMLRDLRILLASLSVFALLFTAPLDRWFGFGPTSGFEIVSAPLQFNSILADVKAAVESEDVTDLEKINGVLAESGLEKFISVDTNEENFVLLKGILPLGRFLEWQKVQKMFDGSMTDVLVLSEVKTAPELSNFPPVESVRLMDPAMITFSNGLVAGIGDTVIDGWNIVAIEADNLQLSKGGDFITVEY